MLNSISWFKATVIQLNPMLMMLQTIKHEANQLLNIDASLDGILSAWLSKLMTTDSPILSYETLSRRHNTAFTYSLQSNHVTRRHSDTLVDCLIHTKVRLRDKLHLILMTSDSLTDKLCKMIINAMLLSRLHNH